MDNKITTRTVKAFIKGNIIKVGNTEVAEDIKLFEPKVFKYLVHGNAIAIRSEKTLWLTHAGFKTKLTYDRLNAILEGFNSQFHIRRRSDGYWTIYCNETSKDIMSLFSPEYQLILKQTSLNHEYRR